MGECGQIVLLDKGGEWGAFLCCTLEWFPSLSVFCPVVVVLFFLRIVSYRRPQPVGHLLHATVVSSRCFPHDNPPGGGFYSERFASNECKKRKRKRQKYRKSATRHPYPPPSKEIYTARSVRYSLLYESYIIRYESPLSQKKTASDYGLVDELTHSGAIVLSGRAKVFGLFVLCCSN